MQWALWWVVLGKCAAIEKKLGRSTDLDSDGQNSLLKIDFYFENGKYYFILYFQNSSEKYFVKVFSKLF